MADAEIQVIGLREFIRGSHSAEAAAPREVDRAIKTLVASSITPSLQSGLRSQIRRGSGRLAGSVQASGNEARITAVHAGWWVYGGSTHSPRGNTMRTRVPRGRVVGDVVRGAGSAIFVQSEDAIARIADIAEG